MANGRYASACYTSPFFDTFGMMSWRFFSPPSLEKKYCSSKNQHPRTSTLLTWWVGFRPPKTWEQEGTRSPQTGEPDSPAVRIWSRSSFPNHCFTQEIFKPRLKDMHIATISFLWISSLCRELQSLQEKKMVELVSGSIWSCTGCANHGHPAASQHSSASPQPTSPTWCGHIRRPGNQSTQLGEGFISFGAGGLPCFLRGGGAFQRSHRQRKRRDCPSHPGNKLHESKLWKINLVLQCLLPWSWYMTTYGKRWFSATCLMQAPSWVPTHHLNAIVNWHDSCWRPCKIHPAKYLLQILKRHQMQSRGFRSASEK